MKRIRSHHFGGPEVLCHEDVQRPTPGAGQVRVCVAATSYSDVDATPRAGAGQGRVLVRLPHTTGSTSRAGSTPSVLVSTPSLSVTGSSVCCP